MIRNARLAARLVATGAVAAVVLSGCGGSPVRAGAAAVVGDLRISTEQLASTVDTGLADPGASQLAADRPAYQRDVLARLIQAEVVEQAARREGVTVTQGEVDAQYSALEESSGGAEQLRQQAAAAGLNDAQVRTLARTRALTQALGDKLTADVDVPQSQLQAAYDAALDTYDQVRTEQVQLADLAAAQALLPQARGLSDEAFAALARTRSLDEATKERGGDMGLQSRGALTSEGLGEYATAAFAARPGDTFAVASERGGHVVRVLERRTTSLEEATPALRRTVLQSQSQAAVQDLVTRTADDLGITVNPRFGTWDPATFGVVERADTGRHEVSSPQAPAGGPSTVDTVPGTDGSAQ